MRTTGSYADPLDLERVNITKGPILMNRRNEMGGLRVDTVHWTG